MGRLFDLVDAYRARYAPHEPSYSRIAEQVGVSRQTLLNWREPKELLDKDFLIALSKATGVPYQRVLDALLEDIGYLREEQEVSSKRRSGPRVRKVKQAEVDVTTLTLAADDGDGEPDVGAPEDEDA